MGSKILWQASAMVFMRWKYFDMDRSLCVMEWKLWLRKIVRGSCLERVLDGDKRTKSGQVFLSWFYGEVKDDICDGA